MQVVVTTAEFADELGVTRETVVRWIRERQIPGAFRRGGRWHIPAGEAEAFAEDYGRAQGHPHDGGPRGDRDEDDDEEFEDEDDDEEFE